MKLIVQIPCLNESDTLPATLLALPRAVEGFDIVEVLIIDDGSTDGTSEVARSLGVDHVVRLNGNQGLARAFMAGLFASILHGADVIVNTDADNQYPASSIAELVRPLVEGRADIAIGARSISSSTHFSPVKRLLQRFGSCVVRSISGVDVLDAPCGFRAISRDAALRLNVFSRFSYTIETIIQGGSAAMRIVNVPIDVNGPTRPSRLFKNNFVYVARSLLTMLSVYLIYRPARFFGLFAFLFLSSGSLLGLRYIGLMLAGQGNGHLQSVVACAILVLCGVFMGAIGTIAHLLGINRRLLEEIRYLELSWAANDRLGLLYRRGGSHAPGVARNGDDREESMRVVHSDTSG